MTTRDDERISIKDVWNRLITIFMALPVIGHAMALIFIVVLFVFLVFSFIPIITVANLLENAGAIAVLLAPITIIYSLSFYEEKKITGKQIRRAIQAAVIRIACENKRMISIPLLSLETNMSFERCELVLKEMERKEIIRLVSDIGKGVVYEMDPKTFTNHRYHETPVFHSKNGGYPWQVLSAVTTLFITFVFFDIQKIVYFFPRPYIIAGACSALLLGMYIWYDRTQYVRDLRRRVEAGVLRYVIDNYGELYLKELPYYTRECYETAEPIIHKWHQSNHCTISYSEDGGVIYTFPNHSRASLVFDYEPNIDPIFALFQHRTRLQLACCYAYLFAVIGGSILLANNGLIFIVAFAVTLGLFAFLYLAQRKKEAERIERLAFQVAEVKKGALTAYELAYNVLMPMEEADRLLRKWERTNIARRVEPEEDSAPLYIISGVVSMSERLESEHV